MRAFVGLCVIASAVGFSAATAQAADLRVPAWRNATPASEWATGYYYDDGYSRACQYGYYYACRYNDYLGGPPTCACWPYRPYWLFHS